MELSLFGLVALQWYPSQHCWEDCYFGSNSRFFFWYRDTWLHSNVLPLFPLCNSFFSQKEVIFKILPHDLCNYVYVEWEVKKPYFDK